MEAGSTVEAQWNTSAIRPWGRRRRLGIDSVTNRYVEIEEGATNHVLVSPFEPYEMLTEVNNEKEKGRMKSTIGAAGMKESYATLNIMAKTTERIVGKMAKD